MHSPSGHVEATTARSSTSILDILVGLVRWRVSRPRTKPGGSFGSGPCLPDGSFVRRKTTGSVRRMDSALGRASIAAEGCAEPVSQFSAAAYMSSSPVTYQRRFLHDS